jgi:citrate/tricarballylate utilization protein
VSPLDQLVAEASRQLNICNACRYCEDYCAVFPALERRRMFAEGDIAYLANLCHDCRACYQACMYTAPHEFDMNLPAMLSEARVAAYDHYARPRFLARILDGGPLSLTVVTLAMLALVLILMTTAGGIGGIFDVETGPGAFYELLPHLSMAAPALAVTAIVGIVAVAGLAQFWRETGGRVVLLLSPRLWATALWEAAVLRWMRGGGGECYYPEELQPSPWRRRMHQLVVWGFLATFAATVAAFIYETALDRLPPYAWTTAPVQLGFWGGLGVIIGTTGLIVLKRRSAQALGDERARAMDYAFLVTLHSVATTGMLLLFLRETALMGSLLAIHLATAFALLLAAPYSKFVHAVYRLGALLRDAHERRAEDARVVSAEPLPGD